MEKLLEDIKESLGITSDDYEVNKNITLKINTVKMYLKKGGADIPENDEEINDVVKGCIAIGVNDLLNNKAGETNFSPAFNILAMQVCR